LKISYFLLIFQKIYLTIFSAASSTVLLVELMYISGVSGASYGLSIPVNLGLDWIVVASLLIATPSAT